MARPKSDIERKALNTKIDVKLLDILKKISRDTGIPINRLLENAIREKYLINKSN